MSCPDTRESGTSESVVPCDTTHVKTEKSCRATDELTDDAASSVARHPGLVSSSDAGLPPLLSIMPPVKRARYDPVCGVHQHELTEILVQSNRAIWVMIAWAMMPIFSMQLLGNYKMPKVPTWHANAI